MDPPLSYHYWWTDSGRDVNFTSFDGGSYSIEWSEGANFIGGKGWNPGGPKKVKYSGTYSPNGNSYLALYGWTTNPLVEYYVVESFGNNDPSSDKEKKGEVTSDNGTYDIYISSRKNVSSLEQTVKQYWSIRRERHINGTITTGNHFDAWARAGLELGSFEYMIMATEGHLSSGSASITVGIDESSSSDSDESVSKRDGLYARCGSGFWPDCGSGSNVECGSGSDCNSGTESGSDAGCGAGSDCGSGSGEGSGSGDQDLGLGLGLGLDTVKAQGQVLVRAQAQALGLVRVLAPVLVPAKVPALGKAPARVQVLVRVPVKVQVQVLAQAPAPAPVQDLVKVRVRDLDLVKGQDLVKTLAPDLTAPDQAMSVAQVRTVSWVLPQLQSQTLAQTRALGTALGTAPVKVLVLAQALPQDQDQGPNAVQARTVTRPPLQSQSQIQVLVRDPILALALAPAPVKDRTQVLPPTRDQILSAARAQIATQELPQFHPQPQTQALARVLVKGQDLVRGQDPAKAQSLILARVLPQVRGQTLNVAQVRIVTQDQVEHLILVQAPERVLEKDPEKASLMEGLDQSQTQDLARPLLQDQGQTLNVVRARIVTQDRVKCLILAQAPVGVLEKALGKVLEQGLVKGLVEGLARFLLRDQDQIPNVTRAQTAIRALEEGPEQVLGKDLEQAPVEAQAQFLLRDQDQIPNVVQAQTAIQAPVETQAPFPSQTLG
ncbi:hypothetical protein CEP51_008516 [Fusarium floridanum]|uniref:endo-1,4-beta-xylanase n=1 Tax=Fusarium floridanum TaxID=1325733 RepID=A0A428RKN3_9HYPO|nr:hypothetical protein CEP51_008516 [Fusarium floridanum]